MLTAQPPRKDDVSVRMNAAWLALFASVLLLALKSVAAYVTGSSAVLSDALESIVNVFTASMAVGVLKFTSAPADEEHPYGHGKAEFFSAVFEGGLIVFAAIAIALESGRSLVRGSAIESIDLGLLLSGFAALGNLALGLHLRRVGRAAKSEALVASSAHVLSDVKTTIGTIGALVVVRLTGWTWADPMMALAIAAHLAWEGGLIVRRAFGGLLDEIDLESLKTLAESIARHRRPGIIDIHHLRAIRSGSFHHVDAHLVVPEYWDVLHMHELTHEFETKVVADYPYDGEIAFHVDPCRRQFCRVCDVAECPIRQRPFERPNSFDLKSLLGEAAEA